MGLNLNIFPLLSNNSNNPYLYKEFNQFSLTHGKLAIYLKSTPKIESLSDTSNSFVPTDEVVDAIADDYFHQEIPGFQAIKNTFNDIVLDLKSNNIEGVVVLYFKSAIYFLIKENLEVRLVRQKSEAILLKGSENLITSISGFPKVDDVMIVSSPNFMQLVNPTRFFKDGESLSVEEKLEEIEESARENEIVDPIIVITLRDGKEPSVVQKETFETPIPQESNSYFEEISKPHKTNILASFFLSKIKNAITVKEGTQYLDETKNKKPLLIGGLFLALLLVSIIFGISKNSKNKVEKNIDEKLTNARSYLSEARNFKDSDKTKARDMFLKAEEEYESVKNTNTKSSKLTEFEKELNDSKGALLGEQNVNLSLYLDLSLISDNFQATSISSDTKDIVFFDKENKKAIKHTFLNKKSLVLAGPSELDKATNVSYYQGYLYALKDDGIYDVAKNKKVIDKDWSENVLMSAYGGNVYLVDKNYNKIYRFSAAGSGFSGRQSWLAPGIDPTFSGVKSVLVDGTMYLSLDNKLVKYNRGAPASFVLDTITPTIDKITSFYTNESLKNIYVLDSRESRVVVFNKEGKFVMQYKNDSIKDASLVFASEEKGEIYIVSKGKINTFSI